MVFSNIFLDILKYIIYICIYDVVYIFDKVFFWCVVLLFILDCFYFLG